MNHLQKDFLDKTLSQLKSETQVRSCLLGAPGTGKSFVFNRLIEEVKSSLNSIKVFTCAVTGVAAKHVNGRTIHSLFGFNINSSCKFENSLIMITDGIQTKTVSTKNLDTHHTKMIVKKCKTNDPKAFKNNPSENLLIIDEISTCGFEMIMSIDKMLRLSFENHQPFGGIHIILGGDFYQLDPIGDTQLWDSELPISFDVFELKESMRCDQELFALCNEVRRCNYKVLEPLVKKDGPLKYNDLMSTIYLFTHRDDCKKFNHSALGFVEYENHGNVCVKERYLCPGLNFIFHKKWDKYFNGCIGKIKQIEDNSVTVEIDNKEHMLPRTIFGAINDDNVIASVFFGLTIHKFQGQTLQKVCVKIKTVFEYALLNVMLSRVRTLEDLSIVNLNDNCDLDFSSEAIANYLYKIKMIDHFVKNRFVKKSESLPESLPESLLEDMSESREQLNLLERLPEVKTESLSSSKSSSKKASSKKASSKKSSKKSSKNTKKVIDGLSHLKMNDSD